MFPGEAEGKDHIEMAKAFLRGELQPLLGLEEARGFEVCGLVHALTHLYDAVESQRLGNSELSGARWRLLAHLMVQERFRKGKGLTPTSLSRFRGVSRNTISSLLRGLEEQGYIQRTLDPEDRRVFRIRLTDAGREVAQSSAAARVTYINQLASDLSDEEREQLIVLLEKLFRSVLAHSDLSRMPPCNTS